MRISAARRHRYGRTRGTLFRGGVVRTKWIYTATNIFRSTGSRWSAVQGVTGWWWLSSEESDARPVWKWKNVSSHFQIRDERTHGWPFHLIISYRSYRRGTRDIIILHSSKRCTLAAVISFLSCHREFRYFLVPLVFLKLFKSWRFDRSLWFYRTFRS